jgi:hypothetical protein
MLPFHEEFPFNAGRLAFAPPFADTVEDVVLAADVLLRLPVPAGARFVAFSFDGDVRVRSGGSETSFNLPTASSSDGSGSALNPALRRLSPGTTHLCLRAPGACKGSLEFWG